VYVRRSLLCCRARLGAWPAVRCGLSRWSSFARRAVVLLALVVATGGARTALAAPGPWVLPAIDLSTQGQEAVSPRLATAPDGTTIAYWAQQNGSNYVLQASTRSPDGAFGAPVDLPASGQYSAGSQLAIARDGTTTGVWDRSDGTNTIVQASTRSPGGAFSAPVNLSAAGQDAGDESLAVAPDGSTTAIWQRSNGTNTIVQASTRAPGGAFSAPVNLSAAGQNASSPTLAVAPDGSTTAIWRRSDGTNTIVQASTRAPGGAFGAPVNLSAAGQDAGGESLAVAPDGTTTAIWQRYNGTNYIVQASTRTPGGAFGAPIDLSAAGQHATSPAMAVALDGTTTAIWKRNITVQASTRAPGGAFGAPVDLSAAHDDARDPQVAVSPDGTTTAIWDASNGMDYIVQTSTRLPGGTFGAPVDLSAGGQDASSPALAVAPDGTTIAIWQRTQSGRFSNTIVQATFTGPALGPPRVNDVLVPPTVPKPLVPKPTQKRVIAPWPAVGLVVQRTRTRGPTIGLLRGVVARVPRGNSLIVTCPASCGSRTGTVLATLGGAGSSPNQLLKRPLRLKHSTTIRIALVAAGKVGRFKTYGFRSGRLAPRNFVKHQGCLEPGSRTRVAVCT